MQHQTTCWLLPLLLTADIYGLTLINNGPGVALVDWLSAPTQCTPKTRLTLTDEGRATTTIIPNGGTCAGTLLIEEMTVWRDTRRVKDKVIHMRANCGADGTWGRVCMLNALWPS